MLLHIEFWTARTDGIIMSSTFSKKNNHEIHEKVEGLALECSYAVHGHKLLFSILKTQSLTSMNLSNVTVFIENLGIIFIKFDKYVCVTEDHGYCPGQAWRRMDWRLISLLVHKPAKEKKSVFRFSIPDG